jgi:hypothetical protein
MCFVALNGQVLHVQKTDMMNDAVSKDVVRIGIGPVISCKEFRDNIINSSEDDENKKQAVADAIMNELEKMHLTAEEKRQKLL